MSQGVDSVGSTLHFGPGYPYDPYEKAHGEKYDLLSYLKLSNDCIVIYHGMRNVLHFHEFLFSRQL